MTTRMARSVLLFVLSMAWTTAASGQDGGLRVEGTVTDSSGAALPGVTVTLTSEDGSPRPTVTNGVGTYRFDEVPAGFITLSFELEGFTSVTRRDVPVGGGVRVDQQLSVGALEESVTVYGLAPLDPPPPPQRPRAPDPAPVDEHDVASVCGPSQLDVPHAPLARLVAHRHDAQRQLYVPGDEFVIDRGTAAGVHVGQNLVVRRQFRVGHSGDRGSLIGEHTSGVIQVVTADANAAFAVVVYACDEFVRGDYVAAFAPEPLRAADPAGLPDYGRAGRVLFADEGQLMGAPRRMLVIDRGREDGLRAGQRLTVFRRGRDGRARRTIGEAVVVAVKARSATVRVEAATDAVQFGDGVAPQVISTQPPPHWAASGG